MILFLFFFWLPALAGVELLSEEEFRQLASDLAPKVNLFREVWAKDPEATFYGGTTRDYLYWLKGKFLEAHSRGEAEAVALKLRKVSSIDVRNFIIGDSDVDVVSPNKVEIKAEDFGIRKFDVISPNTFDPQTELGKNELWQGHAPAEKIRLNRVGISQAKELGDGLHEIYTGKLSVHFAEPEKFLQTKYAKAGENHPILLALRYLRLQAINYYRTHGPGYPKRELLMAALDPASEAAVKKIIRDALNSEELKPYLENQRFRSWINGTIQKSFRSYTNPTAALQLMKEFHVDQLSLLYGEKNIEPIYQYVFAKHRNTEEIAENIQTFQVKTESFFQNPESHFPDGFLYHGTKTESAFRSIIFQGTMPSGSGTAGPGLYGVSQFQKADAEKWGERKERLIKLPVKSSAKIVDITKGEGQRIWRIFEKQNGEDHQLFADTFGIDILKYPYDFEAFVVNNSQTLGQAQGVYRELLPFPEFLAKMKKIQDPKELINNILTNQYSNPEIRQILQETPIPQDQLFAPLKQAIIREPERTSDLFGFTNLWKQYREPLAKVQIPSLSAALGTNEFISFLSPIIYLEQKQWPYVYESLLALSDLPGFGMWHAQAFAYAHKFATLEEQIKFLRIAKEKVSIGDSQVFYGLLKTCLKEANPEFLPLAVELLEKYADKIQNADRHQFRIFLANWIRYPEFANAARNNSIPSVRTELRRIERFMQTNAWFGSSDVLGDFLQKLGEDQQGVYRELMELGDLQRLSRTSVDILTTTFFKPSKESAQLFIKLMKVYPNGGIKQSYLETIQAHWTAYPEVEAAYLGQGQEAANLLPASPKEERHPNDTESCVFWFEKM